MIAASIGSYGASLADGSEFRGKYGLSLEELEEYHREKVHVLLGSGADMIAFETVPCSMEAQAIVNVLSELKEPVQAWISFSCREDGISINDGSLFSQCVEIVEPCSAVVALGINCTHPKAVSSLLRAAKSANCSKTLMCYPNSGETWVDESRSWVEEKQEDQLVRLESLVSEWWSLGARVIGGCCRMDTPHISLVRKVLSAPVVVNHEIKSLSGDSLIVSPLFPLPSISPLLDIFRKVPLRSVELKPVSYFIAWNGVITLALGGFPKSIIQAKEEMEEKCVLGKENFGSKWPKVSLGCLVDGRILSLEELTVLYDLVVRTRETIAASEYRLRPTHVTASTFLCRSQETVFSGFDIPIGGSEQSELSPNDGDRAENDSVVSEQQQGLVDSVLQECTDKTLDSYIDLVNRPGNKETHYRSAHSETSLVMFLPQPVPPFISEFRNAVDAKFPDTFVWFSDPSLHVTVRTLT